MVTSGRGSGHEDTTAGRLHTSTVQELFVCWNEGSRTIALDDDGAVSIGRAEDANVSIPHPSVSRKHAVLHLGSPMLIEDLGSANGTRVDGVAVAPGQRVAVGLGSVVEIGDARLVPRAFEPDAPSPMRRTLDLVDRVARADISVVLVGESGVGKEVLASEIVRRSARARAPFLRLNCAALPPNLLESELFGYEKGAFTGAVQTKLGLFEAANGGSVLLDEIGELAPELQPKLLRVLEERTVIRLGGVRTVPIDVRFVAATNRDLEVLVVMGQFRHDLLFRLSGMTIRIPPLRDRVDEIPALAGSILKETMSLSPAALELLRSYRWPGNVRELRNVLERATLLCDGDRIETEHIVFDGAGILVGESSRAAPPPSSSQSERERVVAALEQCGGNQTEAAKLLGISRRMLGYRLDKLGVRRPRRGS